MRNATLILLAVVFLTPLAAAADLAKLDRSIRKEPAYRDKPKYCLLVFGPEATTRVWLVLAGKRLFVDRNGNGDLTDDGEPVAASESARIMEEEAYEVGEIRDGTRTHKNLTLRSRKLEGYYDADGSIRKWITATPNARGMFLRAEIEMPGWKGNGVGGRVEQYVFFRDAHGFLTFADQPKDAPIIHFGGPWQIVCAPPTRLIAGRETELVVNVGTPGLGAGTFARVAYEGVIPEKVYPRVEFTFPAKYPDEMLPKRHFELKGRC